MTIRVIARSVWPDVFVVNPLVRNLWVSYLIGCTPGWKVVSLLVARIIRSFLGSWYGIRMLTPMNVGGWEVVVIVRL